jgi:hypothetical protein
MTSVEDTERVGHWFLTLMDLWMQEQAVSPLFYADSLLYLQKRDYYVKTNGALDMTVSCWLCLVCTGISSHLTVCVCVFWGGGIPPHMCPHVWMYTCPSLYNFLIPKLKLVLEDVFYGCCNLREVADSLVGSAKLGHLHMFPVVSELLEWVSKWPRYFEGDKME